MQFRENRIKNPIFILSLVGVCITLLFTTKLNPYGYLVMVIGFLSFLFAKIPNLKDKKYITTGVDQIKKGYKVFYSLGLVLMLVGFILLFN